jgi:hypothetical protein
MVDQETVTGDGGLSSSPAGPHLTSPPTGGVDGIMHPLISLVELQAELFRIDVRDGVVRLLTPLILLALAGAVGLATCCVALFLIAELLVDLGGFSRGGAFAIAAAAGLILTAGLVVAAGLCLRASLTVFDRSKAECSRTIEWIKYTLKRPRKS